MLQEDSPAKPIDVEVGGGDEPETFDPNKKSCYDPMMEKMQPVVEKVQPVVEKVKPIANKAAQNVSDFFDDDENEVMTEETIDGSTQEKTMLRITPTAFGAAVIGMLVGSIIAGPIIGLACAGGAGYARYGTLSCNSQSP